MDTTETDTKCINPEEIEALLRKDYEDCTEEEHERARSHIRRCADCREWLQWD